MQIVIKIPEEDYAILLSHADVIRKRKRKTLEEAVINGTPLPEHHGNLIDVNVLKNNIHYVPIAPILQGDYVTYRHVIFADILDMLPTIIEGSESE